MTENQLKQMISEAVTAYKDTATEDIILEFDTEQTIQFEEDEDESGYYVTISARNGITAAFDELVDRRNEHEELENASAEVISAERL